MSGVLPVSGCSPVFSPAPPWRQLTPVGGFVSGVRWPTRGCGSTLIAERLMGKGQWKKRTQEVIFYSYRIYNTSLFAHFQIQGS